MSVLNVICFVHVALSGAGIFLLSYPCGQCALRAHFTLLCFPFLIEFLLTCARG